MPCLRTTLEKGFLSAVLLLACPMQGIGLTIDTEAWEMVAKTASGQIYQRDFVGSFIPWAMIVTTFDVVPARVHAVVVDYDHFAEFIPNVFKSRIVAEEGNEQWVYHHLKFPGPVADRNYVIRSTDQEHRPGQPFYRVEWELDERTFAGIDLSAGIRPAEFSGFWELKAVAGTGTTEARYAIHSDPGGFIPGWLVTGMTVGYLQQVVEAVRTRLGAGDK